ncbi:hypothetical protein [Legionella septentrionalis]|uniref:hypothetical protein n=1 Tax=Legionella septentrionalis TaxID=2498109 RepID=UPI000F8E4CF8|nr:hypothetical protein [Legionella septentrionalis]RUR12403.1 hypothetical protein ELY10_11570 [Legionella septentrionalis]
MFKQNNNDDLNEFALPDTLNSEIKQFVLDKYEEIKLKKNNDYISEFDSYSHELRYFNRIINLFAAQSMVSIWDELINKSTKKTLTVISMLFEYEKIYDEGKQFVEKKKKEITALEHYLDTLNQLFQANETVPAKMFNQELIVSVINEIGVCEQEIEERKNKIKTEAYFQNGYLPLTRKNTMKNALVIFFIRKIYFEFMTEYGIPMYGIIESIIDQIFDAELNQNQIIKYCKLPEKLLSELSSS